MEYLGLITDAQHGRELRFVHFIISPKTLQAVREIAEKEKEMPMDLVEQMKLTLRQKPFVAWPFIVIVVAVFIATAINQIVGMLKSLHLID